MRNVLSANLMRLKKSPVFYLGLLAHIAIGVMRVFAVRSDMLWGYDFSIEDAFFDYVLMIPFTAAVLTPLFLGTEYSDGTLRNKITVGCKRIDVYFAGLITVLIAALLFCIAHALTVLAAGVPLIGFFVYDTKTILLTTLGTLFTVISVCSLYSMVTMNCSHKAAVSVGCIVLYFIMMILTTNAFAQLDANAHGDAIVTMTATEMVVETGSLNPYYLPAWKEAAYQFTVDFIPTGQATQYCVVTDRTVTLILHSLAFVVLTSGVGAILFRRKDLK